MINRSSLVSEISWKDFSARHLYSRLVSSTKACNLHTNSFKKSLKLNIWTFLQLNFKPFKQCLKNRINATRLFALTVSNHILVEILFTTVPQTQYTIYYKSWQRSCHLHNMSLPLYWSNISISLKEFSICVWSMRWNPWCITLIKICYMWTSAKESEWPQFTAHAVFLLSDERNSS